ncbi:hypothetical protein ACM0E1_22815, partial [Salmonella enterica]
MRFCTHSTLTVAYQVVGIISRLSTTCTRLCLNPARVLFINPAASLTRTRDALVADFPGLTRDRKYGRAE